MANIRHNRHQRLDSCPEYPVFAHGPLDSEYAGYSGWPLCCHLSCGQRSLDHLSTLLWPPHSQQHINTVTMREVTVATQLIKAIMPPESPPTSFPLASVFLLIDPVPKSEGAPRVEDVGPEVDSKTVDDGPRYRLQANDEAASRLSPMNLLFE